MGFFFVPRETYFCKNPLVKIVPRGTSDFSYKKNISQVGVYFSVAPPTVSFQQYKYR